MPLRFFGLFLAVFLTATPAYAGMFAGIGNVLKEVGHSMVDDLGVPLTVVSVAWGLLAMGLRLGGMAWALGGLLAGLFLMNLEPAIETLAAFAHG